MSVQVDYFSSSKFIVREDKAERLKELIELLKEQGNTGSGYYSSDHYINLYDYGNNAFSLHTGGYCDGSPELKDTIINEYNSEEYENEEEQNDYCGSHNIFDLIQNMLQEGSWFFVDSTGFEKGRIYNNTSFYHADGRNGSINTWELKRKILEEHGVDSKQL
jgi:hypothetical protein